jgi:rhodanese-related sulfurtransferase
LISKLLNEVVSIVRLVALGWYFCGYEKVCFPASGWAGHGLQPIGPASQRRSFGCPRRNGRCPGGNGRCASPNAKELLKEPGTQVLDVRTSPEYMLGHLSQAKNLNISSDDFSQQVAQLDTSKTYVVYCGSGVRSAKAAEVMRQKGFHHVVNGGGYRDLKE